MKLPKIIAITINENEGVFSLDLSPELEVFQGHFPGHPILAGVVQLDWAMQLAVEYLGNNQRVAQEFKVKFHRIIKPNVPLSLTLQLNRAKGRLFFTYRTSDQIMSSGQITLKVES